MFCNPSCIVSVLIFIDESYLTNGYTDMVMDWIYGMERIRLKDLPRHILATKHDDHELNFCLEAARSADKVSHNIIHTFDELEGTLVKELKSIFPHIYTVGPMHSLMNQITKKDTSNSDFNGYSLWKEEPECIQWLQSKEPISVVYVNFGSLAVMSLKDLIEFGSGLVNNDHYFLWIIRTEPVDGGSLALPTELEDGIKRRAFIASWCSQDEVLNHPSIGGVLTHDGCGSVTESLSVGVPMLCCPVSQEKRINYIQMYKEWEVGMEIGKKVNRYEVEKLVRELMDGIKSRWLRMRAIEWKTKAEVSTAPNGSSTLNIEDLVHEIAMMSRN